MRLDKPEPPSFVRLGCWLMYAFIARIMFGHARNLCGSDVSCVVGWGWRGGVRTGSW